LLTSGRRLTVRPRRPRLEFTAALSLGLHLAILPLVLAVVRLPALPTEPPSVEIVADAGPAEPPASSEPIPAVPAEAVPTEAVPPPPDAPPTPEAQAPPPPPAPPDQTEVAGQEPPPPAAQPPPPRTVARPPPRSSASARTTSQAAHQPAPANPAGVPAQPVEGPEASVQVEGAQLGPDWIKQLQGWWDQHAFFPGEAVTKNISGNVKVHLVVRPDGEVSTIHVEQGADRRLSTTRPTKRSAMRICTRSRRARPRRRPMFTSRCTMS
jgi:outer membrane biosynthesis protein TonB